MKFYDIDGDKQIKIESSLYEMEILRNILKYIDDDYCRHPFCVEEEKFINKNLKKIQKSIDVFKKLTIKNNKKRFEDIKI